jgi:hypothetical protein
MPLVKTEMMQALVVTAKMVLLGMDSYAMVLYYNRIKVDIILLYYIQVRCLGTCEKQHVGGLNKLNH